MIAENIRVILESIPKDKVTVVAVTKTQSPEVIREAFDAGMPLIGENRVQEALGKAVFLSDLPLEWHLIGHLQTNKVKQAVALFSLIHSVDSPKLVIEIDKCAKNMGKIQDVLIQVNVSGEITKSGVSPEQIDALAALIDSLPNVRLCGLMTIAPLYADAEQARPIFREMYHIFNNMKRNASHPESFRWLSMGMSHDYRIAVEEGATMVRIGTGIFGARISR